MKTKVKKRKKKMEVKKAEASQTIQQTKLEAASSEFEKLKQEMIQSEKEKIIKSAPKKKSKLDELRDKYKRQKRTRNEDDTLEKLTAFKTKVEKSHEDPENWMNNKLKFVVDSSRAFEFDKKPE